MSDPGPASPGAPDGEAAFRAVLARDPFDPAAILGLGGLLQLQERSEDALAMTEAVLRAKPEHGEAWLVRGDAFLNLERYGEAVEAYRRVFVRRDLGFDALVRLGLAFSAMDRFDLAIESLDAAVTLRPDSAEARFKRGQVKLRFGAFETGWDDFEQRWRSERFVAASRGVVSQSMVPALTLGPAAADLAGRRVLVVGEQGIGDQLMFASIIPDLARAARQVTCVCEARLTQLLAQSLPGVTVLSPAGAQVDSDDIDVVVAIGSLGSAYRRSAADFSGEPYLRASQAAVQGWAERLGPRTGKLRVGLSWRGGVVATRRRARSLPLSALAPVLALPDCEFVSLQYGDVAAEVAAVNASRAEPIRMFPGEALDDFVELAGLLANMDVVVSVQTAIVHLAGALGRRCLALVPQNPEWRYGAGGPTISWYRSVRLFRQPGPGAWEPVIRQAAEAVRSGLSSGAV